MTRTYYKIRSVRWVKVTLALSLILFSSLLTTGCYDRMELEQQAFVVALGIDQAPNNMVDCSFLIALPISPSGGGQSGTEPKAASGPITFRARSLVEAMQMANSSVERSLNLSHLGLVVFGADVAKAGLSAQLYPMVRFREFRRTMLLAVSQGSAKDILSQNKPVLDRSTSRWADDIIEIGRRSGVVPVVTLHDYLRSREENLANPLLPLCAVNQSVQSSQSRGGASASGSSGGSSSSGVSGASGSSGTSEGIGGAAPGNAGTVARAGGNPVEWAGATVFRDDKMIDQLTGRQVMDVTLLQGRLAQARFTFSDPTSPARTVTLRMKRAGSPRYDIQLGRQPIVRVDLPLEADLISTQASVNYANQSSQMKLEQRIEQRLSTELSGVLKHLCQDDGVDVIPISDYIRGRFATDAALQNYPWATQLRRSQISVEAQVQVRRFGISNPMQS
ncbi:Ger(x)C family spore germination protein [Alicyclobacillus sp. ALC3]|uniref:Ger(x)C family spore germination protein n=1 Tax=Alicyclobacillus sp. ALC3 TaxID=2796143 RepID=UPI002378643E|nr:Ger(x)C family spore germination protein [Alicyclobacillus sp. ALC3]WDL97458.1 Ger(x)C family spore germination protein [Alicyclobacillus sp. ALC3]